MSHGFKDRALRTNVRASQINAERRSDAPGVRTPERYAVILVDGLTGEPQRVMVADHHITYAPLVYAELVAEEVRLMLPDARVFIVQLK